MAVDDLTNFGAPDALDELMHKLETYTRAQWEAEVDSAAELLKLRISNAEALAKKQAELITKNQKLQLEYAQKTNEKLLEMGFETNKVLASQKRKDELAEAKRRLKNAKDKDLRAQAKLDLARVKTEYKNRTKEEKELDRLRAKQDAARFAEQKKQAQSIYGNTFNTFFNPGRTKDVIANLKASGLSDEEAKSTVKWAKFDAAVGALGNYATKLKGTIDEVGKSQAAIDTRLYGSGNEKSIFGSYWTRMSEHITSRVGMSPLIKQADVVNNLKTLVGQGIAFDVEQRAFLQTISEKIATTFNATDATLLKLVRIQQADTTAARLGMEAALNEFLNSMYETTEYMQSAASEIRANLYEASALMGAADATAFEYQVQKWMGSLHSVGFSNTSGLSGALGKLAAGDISGITDGGYGNLLVMAANRAGLSIADILADGLDDSKTNELMQAMVEYLGDIYNETKDSRVVAQQYANVFGLTASDLKAAANLYGSTGAISKNNLGYNGMLSNLNKMANSMYSRTSTGEMMGNLMENLNYSMAASIGNNPVLYSLYSVASMLKDVTGDGLSFSIPLYMGTGTAQTFNIPDLMLAGSMAGGILSGMGQMIAGLGTGGGFSGAGMLKAFGVNENSITTLTRGTGTGISAMSGMTTSESGYAGSGSADDIQNKMMSDTTEDQNQKVKATEDEHQETKLSDVDEHVVQIYKLLENVTNGVTSFKVDMGDANAWISSIREGNGI